MVFLIIVKEYNHHLQKEYNTYRKEHYSPKNPITGEYYKPKIISLEEITNSKTYESNLAVNPKNDDYYILYQSLEILSKKNPFYHMLIILHYFEEMTFIEIAAETGKTRQTISANVNKAKNELRKIIEGINNDE